jgi:hypothetical protein
MNRPQPNLPGVKGPVPSATYTEYTYDSVPELKHLLPQLRGVPGFYYLQVAIHNQRRAEAEGWREVAGGVTYTIRGPKGSCDARLYCFGDRIYGSDYKSSKRDCLVDTDIFELTGWANGGAEAHDLSVQETPVLVEEPAPVVAKPVPGKSVKTTAASVLEDLKPAEVGDAEESK